MSNAFGRLFRVVTFGESHGPAMGAVIDGCPAGVALDVADLQRELARDPRFEALATPRREPNEVQLLSGVLDGRTLGTPIALVLANTEARPADYADRRDLPRPGHAELTWQARFGLQDWRGGGRASGREAAARVAAGAVARALLTPCGLTVSSRVVELAGVPITGDAALPAAVGVAAAVGAAGDSTGGVFELEVGGAPAGLGAPVFGKLKADLPAALFSIGAVAYVALGDGLDAPRATGSDWNDAIVTHDDGRVGTATNRCGGLLGGLSTGEPIRLRVGVKPTPSVAANQDTVNLATRQSATLQLTGRFDANVTPRVARVAEAMVALTLVDHLLLAGWVHPTRFELSSLLTR